MSRTISSSGLCVASAATAGWTFWTASTRWTPYPVSGRFHLRHPYQFATSGGPDVTVTLARAPGSVDLDSVSLVPPTEPERVIRNPP